MCVYIYIYIYIYAQTHTHTCGAAQRRYSCKTELKEAECDLVGHSIYDALMLQLRNIYFNIWCQYMVPWGTYIHINMHSFIHVLFVCEYACIHTIYIWCLDVTVTECLFMYLHTCIHIYIYIYIYIHTYRHTLHRHTPKYQQTYGYGIFIICIWFLLKTGKMCR